VMMLTISELSGNVLPFPGNTDQEWSTPVMVEMVYTNALRQLYREKVPHAA
jgi:hypothetical protein